MSTQNGRFDPAAGAQNSTESGTAHGQQVAPATAHTEYTAQSLLSGNDAPQHKVLAPPSHASPHVTVGDGISIKPSPGYDPQFDYFDRFVRATTARRTQGLSPHALTAAWFDWALHLSRAPGRQMDLMLAAMTYQARLWRYATGCATGQDVAKPFQPRQGDRRFDAPQWQDQPYCMLAQSHLALEAWWALATTGLRGVSDKHAERVSFMATQFLDVLSPTNSAFTNPLIVEKLTKSGGGCLRQGLINLTEDVSRELAGEAPRSAHKYQVGRDLAATPGRVVHREHLFELIQYEPATQDVRAEPVLITPAWIMKYYILDLHPGRSLVEHLVKQGHTVFVISWLNPGPADRDIGLDDYRRAVMSAVDGISASLGDVRIHLTGYCLGGTIAAITAATMARDGDERLASLTLLAAQTDFSEAGELMLFVDESQVAFVEDMMWAQGVLQGRQMSGAFRMLRTNDLVWSRMIREYVLGERDEVFEIQAWSEDLTRMPYKMHSQYLRGLFMENRLTAGRFAVDGRVIALKDIKVPMFVVGTETDHIAPWRSVYKAHLFTGNEMTFLLTNGGHNAGILSEPGHKHRHYRLGLRKATDSYRDPDTWASETDITEGSWWPVWTEWLTTKSTGSVAARDTTHPAPPFLQLGPAPGTYVLER